MSHCNSARNPMPMNQLSLVPTLVDARPVALLVLVLVLLITNGGAG